jgi:hypothetical protein
MLEFLSPLGILGTPAASVISIHKSEKWLAEIGMTSPLAFLTGESHRTAASQRGISLSSPEVLLVLLATSSGTWITGGSSSHKICSQRRIVSSAYCFINSAVRRKQYPDKTTKGKETRALVLRRPEERVEVRNRIDFPRGVGDVWRRQGTRRRYPRAFPLVYVEMDPGDVPIFFHSNLLHASAENTSDKPRWSMICCYTASRGLLRKQAAISLGSSEAEPSRLEKTSWRLIIFAATVTSFVWRTGSHSGHSVLLNTSIERSKQIYIRLGFQTII